ncbi:MAG: hypothetical protein NT007_15400 [Candidatus Kapabacteria bacterium]|nr:hypothetical protein [Candidatus Kapabacteria bacterium]
MNAKIKDIVNNELIAKIEYDSFNFSPWTGIQVYKFRMLTDGDTIFYVKKLHLDFEIMKLLNNEFVITTLEIDQPNVKILRSGIDSLWNVSHIAKPSNKPPSANSSKFHLNILKLKITGGRFILYDSTWKRVESKTIDFTHFGLNSINLDMSAYLKLEEPAFNVNINSLSACETFTNFNLSRFSASAILDTSSVRLTSLNAIAENQEIIADLGLGAVNIFGDPTKIDWNKVEPYIDLKAPNFNAETINYFAALPFKLYGTYSIETHIQGKFDDLQSKLIKIKGENVNLDLSGKLLNLFDPKKFYLDFTLSHSKVTRNAIIETLKDFGLNAIPDFGNARINKIRGFGFLDSMTTIFDIETTSADLNGFCAVGLHEKINYSSNISFEKFNLKNILNNPELNSDLNGNLEFKGSGTDLPRLFEDFNIKLQNSTFMQYAISSGQIKARLYLGSKLCIDTIAFSLKNNKSSAERSSEAYSKIGLSGNFDFPDLKLPKYSINIQFLESNLQNLLDLKIAPQLFSANLNINGRGIDPDSLNTEVKADIRDLIFSDKSLLPFKIYTEIRKDAENQRSIRLLSGFVDMMIDGKFRPVKLVDNLISNSFIITNFIFDKIRQYNPETGIGKNFNSRMLNETDMSLVNDYKVNINVKDASIISSLVDKLSLDFKASTEMSFFSDSTKNIFKIEKLNIPYINLSSDSLRFIANEINADCMIASVANDSIYVPNNIKIKLSSDSTIKFNDNTMSNNLIDIDMEHNQGKYNIKTNFNKMVNLSGSGKFILSDQAANFIVDKLETNLFNKYIWRNAEPIRVQFDNSGMDILSFKILKNQNESISASGRYNFAGIFDNIRINAANYQLAMLDSILSKQQLSLVGHLAGNIDMFEMKINGKLDNPVFSSNLFISNLTRNNYLLGSFFSDLKYSDSTVKGNVKLIKKNSSERLFYSDINSLPLNLAFADVKNRFVNKEAKIYIEADKFPIETVSEFIPAISNVTGLAKATLNIGGILPDSINYYGNLDFSNGTFIVTNTGVKYKADGNIGISLNYIDIKNVNIKNYEDDSKNGSGQVSGWLTLRNFRPDSLMLEMNLNKFLLLNRRSQKTMPFLFGPFIVSSGQHPLRFWGTLQEPVLDGDVEIQYADLEMPETASQRSAKSKFNYEVMGNNIKITPNTDSSQISGNKIFRAIIDTVTHHQTTAAEVNFADQINYELSIKIPGRLLLKMDLGIGSQILSEITVADKTMPFIYIKNRNAKEPLIIGELVLQTGSTFKFFKTFATSGKISFPTGVISNPGLDLVASYTGQGRNYNVKIFITGTKIRPIIKLTYSIDNEEASGDSNKITTDALFLLLTGKTKSETFVSGTLEFGSNFGKSVGESTLSTLTSILLTQILGQSGMIQSADIDYQGGSLSNAKLKLSGTLGKYVKWNYSGSMSELKNNEFSIDIPLSAIFGIKQQIDIGFSGNLDQSSTPIIGQKDYEFKFKYGNSW